MKRINMRPRPDWRTKMENVGFDFHTIEGAPYWDESACYEMSADEVDELESATNELHEMCLAAVDHVVSKGLCHKLGIPANAVDYIESSWRKKDASVYGRFDMAYDGAHPPKLLEYNADTPTSLVEAAVAQWTWLEDIYPAKDQFNSLHERLIERWKEVSMKFSIVTPFYFACAKDSVEDLRTVEYMMDTAAQAGIIVKHTYMDDVGCSAESKKFVDMDNQLIDVIFKLYPWEWIVTEEFGQHVIDGGFGAVFEPAWKLILSGKGILPILWEMFPGHKNLLPAFFENGMIEGEYVRKPLFSREGANVTISSETGMEETSGGYGAEGYVYQQYHSLPVFDGNRMVIGSWIIGDESAGIGIREDISKVTGNGSRFVPHYFE